MVGELHEQIIDRAASDGWKRGNWKKPLQRALRKDPWISEAEDIIIDISFIRRNPDAFRIVVEQPGDTTPWLHPVLVLEFLEVEITHQLPPEKRDDYTELWVLFDASNMCAFRVYTARADGVIKLWLDGA